ncbi:hypothetical protein [Streptomyces sp. cmx-4-7]|uniref:hypothetical protein n=1 Tax=Streptomyces sp. cmx-4-7 TaxID=2790939 RepID=UPI00397FF3FB
MIDRSYLLSSAHLLRQLLELQVGMRRDAEELMRTAMIKLDEATLRVSASEKALGAVESRLADLVPPQHGGQDELFSTSPEHGSRTAKTTVAEVVRSFLVDREEATAGEIVAHVQERRPDTPPGKRARRAEPPEEEGRGDSEEARRLHDRPGPGRRGHLRPNASRKR